MDRMKEESPKKSAGSSGGGNAASTARERSIRRPSNVRARSRNHSARIIHQPKEDTKGGRTKERILDAALRLFSKSGSNAVSIRAIASEAGISHAGLLRYFTNKNDLIIQAIRRRDMTTDSARSFFAHTGESSSETVIPWLLDSIRNNIENPGIVATFVKLSAEATDANHPAHDYFQKRYGTFTRRLAHGIAELTDSEADKALCLAQEFIAYMDGIQIQWLLDPKNTDMLADARDFLERIGIDVQEIIERYPKRGNSDDER